MRALLLLALAACATDRPLPRMVDCGSGWMQTPIPPSKCAEPCVDIDSVNGTSQGTCEIGEATHAALTSRTCPSTIEWDGRAGCCSVVAVGSDGHEVGFGLCKR